ncbi:hypothetical protein NF681_11485 [Comamonadaceae bacterium OTU4NAUVB1]|nr:hypothetical protein NF681_11485 [Comamonadaceae bacterium OTU4NAUVB1]
MSNWYREGTISLVNGSTTVTGTGTSWLENVAESNGLKTPIGPEEIESVTSNTVLQLVTPYAGPTISNVAYSIIPTQGVAVSLVKKVVALLSASGVVKDAFAAGQLAKTIDMEKRVTLTQLAAAAGVDLVGYDGGSLQDIADGAKTMQGYVALRAYTGRARSVRLTAAGIAGIFERDFGDTTSVDNGGTIIVDAGSRRWKRSFAGDANILWFGAGASGSTDDTAAIQAAFNAEPHIFIPKRDFIVNAVDPNYPNASYGGGVKFKNGSFVTAAAGARFLAKSNANTAPAYVIANLRDTTNVTIYNLEVVGSVDTHTGSPGEWGMGFYVAGAINPRLFNCVGRKCWGDGFYVGNSIETSTNPTTGGILSNCLGDDNRRQGLSIVSWSKGLVDGGEYNNTGKTKFVQPAYGIDIEPDPSGQDVIDVVLIGVRTFGNKYGGLQLVPGFMTSSNYASRNYNVTVIGYESRKDGSYGALRFANPDLNQSGMVVANKINGSIRLSGVKIVESVGRGVDFARWIPASPDVIIDGIEVIDPNTSGGAATLEDQSGLVMFMAAADAAKQTGHGKVTIINPRIVDTRSPPKIVLAIQMGASAGQTFSGIEIRNPSGSGWSSTANGLVRAVNASGVSVTFDTPPNRDFAGSTGSTNAAFAGYSIALSASGVFTLPPANTSIGLTYIFQNRYGVTMQIRPDASDTVLDLGRTPGNDVVLTDKGDQLAIKSIGGNAWEVVRCVGRCRALGFSRPPTIVYVGAMPTTGAWARGDQAIRIDATVGQPKGWIRITTGSGNALGTDWVSLGNL